MAKRSDFAHKLLDDLRSRKERMAAAHSSNHSKTTAIDAYAYSKQTHRGSSRETKTRTIAGSRTGNAHIVPFGKGESSAQAGNLSMALAFALENMHKLGNNSMLNFLQQIGKGDGLRTSTSRFPTFSHLHIKEISKGALKLNQILNACSNDHNFNKYSVEIGKELLKGAIDLEESLRRLVNAQEGSRRKSRITLLEEDDDNDEDIVMTNDQKQLDLPRFSFDRPSRNSPTTREVARSGVAQRAAAPSYTKGASDSNRERQALITSNSGSHVRKASYGQKGRVPSVIVKLMGLDELPENVDPKHTIHKKSRDTHNLAQQSVKQKAMKQNSNDASAKQKKLKDVAKSKSKEAVINDELQQITAQKQKRRGAAAFTREKTAREASKPQSHLVNKIEHQEEKDRWRAKQKIHIKPMPSKWFQDKRQHEGFDRKGSSVQLLVSMKGSMKRNSDENSPMKYLESQPDGAAPFLKEKAVHVPVTRKLKHEEMHKRKGSLNRKTGTLKQQSASARERKHEISGGGAREAEAHITKSNESDARIQATNQENGQTSKFDEIISITGNKLQPKEIFKPAIQNPLTESEKQLKHILMKSQLFLDTAQALLKLNLSFVILNAGGHDCLDEDEKLLLDCGYEIMMRKGTRREISIHPYAKLSITSKRIVSVDELVKQLDKDFEVLKLYGESGRKDCNPEDCLPKMLGSDVHDRYPDMNCMWDGSWDANVLAFLEGVDVIKEVERYVLSGLVSEICVEFLCK